MAPDDPQSKLIAATREGGLGGRLLAVVNAKSFPTRSVEKVDKIFSADFIENSQTGALLSDDLGSAEFQDETLRAFFEMRLMARCRTIYAGGSVYAFVASTMGDIALAHAKTLFDGSRAAEIILGELSRHRTFVARQRRRVHGVGRQSLGSASA